MLSEYDMAGNAVSRQLGEGVIELYGEGKLTQVLAASGERLIHYTYDEDGNPAAITMEGSRRRLKQTGARH